MSENEPPADGNSLEGKPGQNPLEGQNSPDSTASGISGTGTGKPVATFGPQEPKQGPAKKVDGGVVSSQEVRKKREEQAALLKLGKAIRDANIKVELAADGSVAGLDLPKDMQVGAEELEQEKKKTQALQQLIPILVRVATYEKDLSEIYENRPDISTKIKTELYELGGTPEKYINEITNLTEGVEIKDLLTAVETIEKRIAEVKEEFKAGETKPAEASPEVEEPSPVSGGPEPTTPEPSRIHQENLYRDLLSEFDKIFAKRSTLGTDTDNRDLLERVMTDAKELQILLRKFPQLEQGQEKVDLLPKIEALLRQYKMDVAELESVVASKPAPEKGTVLRPVGSEERKTDPLFKIGDTVLLLDKNTNTIVEWKVKANVRSIKTRHITLERAGESDMILRQPVLRRLVDRARTLEPKIETQQEPQETEESFTGREDLYFGKTVTIPDGPKKGAWQIILKGSKGVTLEKIGSKERLEKDYEEIDALIADYEKNRAPEDSEQENSPEAKERKLKNPPVGDIISLFGQARRQQNPKALYEAYLTWERNWLYNNRITDYRNKKGIDITNEQIEECLSVLGSYRTMLRLKAEGKPININGATGSIESIIKILAGVHDEKWSDIKDEVDTYTPGAYGPMISKLQREIANAKTAKPEPEDVEAAPQKQVEKRPPQTLAEWTPIIRNDFEQLVANNLVIKKSLTSEEKLEIETEEKRIHALIETLERALARIAANETQRKALKEEIDKDIAAGETPDPEMVADLEKLNAESVELSPEEAKLADQIYSSIKKYQESIKRKSKIVEARQKTQATMNPASVDRTAFEAREKIRREEEVARKERVKKLLEEQHDVASGAKLEDGEKWDWTAAREKMSRYIGAYTDREEIPGTNEVVYRIKKFENKDQRDIVRKRLSDEKEVIYILSNTETHPDNKGKIIRLMFSEADDKEIKVEAVSQGVMAERYSPQTREEISNETEEDPTDTRTEEERVQAKMGIVKISDLNTPQTSGMIRPAMEIARGLLTPEEKAERNDSVWKLLESRLAKLKLGKDGLRWWAIAGPMLGAVVIGSTGVEGTPTASTSAPLTPEKTTGSTINTAGAGYMSPELEAFSKQLTSNEIETTVRAAVKSDDPNYVQNLLDASARPILYDNSGKIPAGVFDQKGKDHRNELSIFLKNLEGIAIEKKNKLRAPGGDPSLLQEAIFLSSVPEKNRNGTAMTVREYMSLVYSLAKNVQ